MATKDTKDTKVFWFIGDFRGIDCVLSSNGSFTTESQRAQRTHRDDGSSGHVLGFLETRHFPEIPDEPVFLGFGVVW